MAHLVRAPMLWPIACMSLCLVALAASREACGSKSPSGTDHDEACSTDQESMSVLQVTSARGQSDFVTEYQALATTSACREMVNCTDTKLQWLKITYPKRPFHSVDDVVVEDASGDPALGRWDNMPLGAQAVQLAMKLDGKDSHSKKAYAFINNFELGPPGTNWLTGNAGGCCATIMRIYDKDTGDHRDIDILSVAKEALSDQPVTYITPTHTFSLNRIEGTLYAFMAVQYKVNQTEDNLGNVLLDAVICLSMEDGKTIKKTAGGLKYFSIFDNLGTFSGESIYKIRFIREFTDKRYGEQYHMNGLSVFTTSGGVTVLGYTTYYESSVVLLRDPWTYTPAEGGGEILQRFGTPGYAVSGTGVPFSHPAKNQDVPRRHFGMPHSEGWMMGIHNLYYYTLIDGTEWISFFNNLLVKKGQDKQPMSAAWSFQVKVAPQSSIPEEESTDEEVFATNYTVHTFGNSSLTQGGCRPLGYEYSTTGVFICGTTSFGPTIHDSHGGVVSVGEQVELYDIFPYFTK